MQKRGILCIVLLTVILLITSCDSKPSDMNDTVYHAGLKAVEITEDYLNMDITADAAYAQLDAVYDRMGKSDDESISDLGVRIAINSLAVDMLSYNYNSPQYVDEKVKEDLEDLKKLLK